VNLNKIWGITSNLLVLDAVIMGNTGTILAVFDCLRQTMLWPCNCHTPRNRNKVEGCNFNHM